MKRICCLLAVFLLASDIFAQPVELSPELVRARELSELDWTPLHDIQLYGKKDKRVKALTPMHGMLYSSAAENNHRVPYDISLYTFLTCLHNPYSLLYTESRNPSFPRSAYGFEYHGGKLSGPWMGCVCSIFSSYVAGFEFQYGSSSHAKLCEKGILSRPQDQTSQGVEPFDIIWQKGHCRIITDVTRDENGRVTAIEISESVSPTVKRVSYTPAAFDSLMEAKKMIFYRRADMSRQGTPPVYEMPDTLVCNDAICTYAGDRACFKEGDRIVIHCFDLSCRTMELYREGELVKTIKLKRRMLVDNQMLGIRGNLELDPGAYAVDLSDLNLGYGKYEARLVNGSKRSDPTRFEIISCSVKYEDGRLYFSSSPNAKPVYLTKGWLHYILSEGALSRGYVKVKNATETTKLYVTFQGEYGRVSAHIPRTK